jgi:hypothetical protein
LECRSGVEINEKYRDENIGMTEEHVNVLCKLQPGTLRKYEEHETQVKRGCRQKMMRQKETD